MKLLLIDTNVIIRRLRGMIDESIWQVYLSGRAPVISPVTFHELRRGIRPGSPWESEIDRVPAPLVDPPSEEDWITAGDLIRIHFWKMRKGLELARLQNDALIALTAKRLNAELWSQDGDMRVLCDQLGVRLLVE